ncbi:MAG: MarR family transcriptional regulator [Mycobacteriales bacterium]
MPASSDPLPDLLLHLVRLLDPVTEQAMSAAHGATLAQLAGLRVLDGRPQSVTALAEQLGVHRSSASRLVDRLVAGGFATRTPSPTSGREVVVAATALGVTAARNVATRRRKALTTMLRDLPEDQREQVTGALRLLVASLGAHGS